MMHLSVFNSSIAAGTVLAQVTNVADPIVATSGSGFLVGLLNRIARVWGVGPTPGATPKDYVQLTSGTLRQYTPFDISPINVGELIETPARLVDFRHAPIPLQTDEELDAFGVHSAVGASRMSVGVLFSDGPLRPVTGRMFTARWTATATLTANAWTSTAITFDNGLPSGTFAIVGSRAFSATGLFHRWIPRGGPAYRPGTTMAQAMDSDPRQADRYGEIGEWLRFTNTTPPQVEIFATGADTSEMGWLDLMQVG